MIYFTAHTFKCVCHCRRAMFRVLGMYNFGTQINSSKPTYIGANGPLSYIVQIFMLKNGLKTNIIILNPKKLKELDNNATRL